MLDNDRKKVKDKIGTWLDEKGYSFYEYDMSYETFWYFDFVKDMKQEDCKKFIRVTIKNGSELILAKGFVIFPTSTNAVNFLEILKDVEKDVEDFKKYFKGEDDEKSNR